VVVVVTRAVRVEVGVDEEDPVGSGAL
jgi:hypothetical protein